MNDAVNDFEKDFYKLMNNFLIDETMENVRNRVIVKFTGKKDFKQFVKKISIVTFNTNHQFYTNYNGYAFRQNEVPMDKPIHLGFAVSDLSNSKIYDKKYDKLQTNFGEKNSNTLHRH